MNLPDVLPGHWDTDEGSGMAKSYLEKTRAQLCGGQHSDMAVAFIVAMVGRNDLDAEAKLSMGRDRIRWLSAKLAVAEMEAVRPVSEHPRVDWREQPPDVLVYSDFTGWAMGRVYHFPDGSIITTVSHVSGNVEATHYKPLPAKPEGAA